MHLKKFNPVTNSLRHHINIRKSMLVKSSIFLKTLSKGLKRFYGRSSVTGRITVRHKGGGCKKVYKKISFINSNKKLGLVLGTFYDSFRTGFVSLVYNYLNKGFFFTLATANIHPGTLIYNNLTLNELKLGCSFILNKIPAGSLIHCLSTKNQYSTFIRSAGTFGQLIQKSSLKNLIRLPSGKIIGVNSNSIMSLGILSNVSHSSIVIGSAGRNRHLGKRPSVRGIAMNPVDHPHGGRTNGGRPSVTPWGIPTKGKPTVKKK
jgi:large subunit ribosomal protein L2